MLIVVGTVHSGKTEFGNAARSLGFHVVEMGDKVRELHSQEDPERPITDFVTRKFIQEGKDVIAKCVVNRIKSCSRLDTKKLVIIGPRTHEEIIYLKRNLGYARTVLVEANSRDRYNRWRANVGLLRPRSPEMTYEEFIERNHIEYKWGLSQVLTCKNDIITNEQALSTFKRKAKAYLKEILSKEDLLLGRFEMKELLGAGQSKETWKAYDHQLGRDVALKQLIIQNGIQKLLGEARTASSLRHENIAQIFEFYEEEGILAEEYVEGKDLRSKIKENCLRGTPMSITDSAEIFAQLLEAVCAAHDADRLHGDIKPANVMLCSGDKIKVKLTDFEVGTILSEIAQEGDQPMGGSRNYMAPEMLEGKPRSKQTDLFSLGIVGYLLFTHRNPFQHPSGVIPIEEMIKLRTFNPAHMTEWNPALPQRLDDIVLKLLARDLGDRYEEAENVKRDFSSINFKEETGVMEIRQEL